MSESSIKSERKKEIILDVLYIIFGSAMFTIAMYCFIIPARMVSGGVTGISVIITHLIEGTSVGTVNFVLNIPIMTIGLLKLGKTFMLKTILSVVSFTLFMNYGVLIIAPFQGEPILGAIYGGLLAGIGIGICLSRGGSTGGLDIPNKIISKKMPHVPISTIIMCSDMVIVGASIILFGAIEPALYTCIMLYVCAKSMDVVLYGVNKVKMVLIISSKPEELSEKITKDLKRGATVLNGYGAYTQEPVQTILCAVTTREYVRFTKTIKQVDPKAFVIITDANEVLGTGFKPKYTST